MRWLNEPPQWSGSDNQLVVKTAPKTDFWRITHYGFIRDNGHFYFSEIASDFTMEVTIRGEYKDLYDQAGIMLRVDEKYWIKTGIEYVDGIQNLSAVVTHDYSDWSRTPLPDAPESLRLKVERRQETIQIFYWEPPSGYVPFRMTYLPTSVALQVGLMCASPEGDGCVVTFEFWIVSSASSLHQ
jgi:uncharacterized protein